MVCWNYVNHLSRLKGKDLSTYPIIMDYYSKLGGGRVIPWMMTLIRLSFKNIDDFVEDHDLMDVAHRMIILHRNRSFEWVADKLRKISRHIEPWNVDIEIIEDVMSKFEMYERGENKE